jgi:hypothetical protein
MNKFSVKSKYISASPRSQRRKGAVATATPSAGVAASSGVDRSYIDANFVNLFGDQAIEGLKDFVNGFMIGGALVKYDATKKCFIFTENVLMEKGMAWNSRFEDFTKDEIFSITKAVDVDWKTIGKNASGQLYVINGGGEGGEGNYDPDFLHNYLTNNKYITQPTLADTLQPYATTDAVNSLLTEYLPKSGGTVNGNITATKFIGALQGNADSAYRSTFSYKLGNVHGSSANYAITYFAGQKPNNTTPTADNIYLGSDASWSVLSSPYSDGTTSVQNLMSMRLAWDNDFWHEIATSPNAENKLWHRSINSGAAQDWQLILDSSNYKNYALPLTGGTVDGDITATGNVSAQAFYGYHNGDIYIRNSGGDAYLPLIFSNYSVAGSQSYSALFTAQNVDVGINPYRGTLIANSFIGALQGNADSATKLATPCTLWGQSFDGTVDIDGDMEWVNSIRYSTLSSAACIYVYGKDYDSRLTRSDIGIKADIVAFSDKVAIGDITATEALHVHGNILATGRIAWNSSRVLKTEIKEHYLSLEKLAQIKPYQYKWKDGRDDLVHVGAIADEVMDIMPETVLTDTLGIHSMDYAQTAFVMAASLTPHVSDHERRIKDLETENKALKEEIEKLKRAA